MNNGLEELGRHAVACPGWRWTPGCGTTNGGRIVKRLDYAGTVKMNRPTIQYAGPNGGANWYDEADFTKNGPSGIMALIPDLADRATIGCLEGLVTEAWDAPLMYVEPCGGAFEPIRYEVRNLLGRIADGYPIQAFVNISGPTKVEALVNALERAPRRKVGDLSAAVLAQEIATAPEAQPSAALVSALHDANAPRYAAHFGTGLLGNNGYVVEEFQG